ELGRPEAVVWVGGAVRALGAEGAVRVEGILVRPERQRRGLPGSDQHQVERAQLPVAVVERDPNFLGGAVRAAPHGVGVGLAPRSAQTRRPLQRVGPTAADPGAAAYAEGAAV